MLGPFLNPDQCCKLVRTTWSEPAVLPMELEQWRETLADFVTVHMEQYQCALVSVKEEPTLALIESIEASFVAVYALYNNVLYYLNKETPQCLCLDGVCPALMRLSSETPQETFISLEQEMLQQITATTGHRHRLFLSTLDEQLGECGLVYLSSKPSNEVYVTFDKAHYIVWEERETQQRHFYYYSKAENTCYPISLTASQLNTLMEAIGGVSLKRLSSEHMEIIQKYTNLIPAGFNYYSKQKLKEMLQYLSLALFDPRLTSIQKKGFAERLFEERRSCHEGFHGRVGDIITELSLLDFNLPTLLAKMRQSIVTMVAARSDYGGMIHTHNRYFTLAAAAGYGVLVKNEMDIFHGIDEDEEINRSLQRAFTEEYQLPSILQWLFNQIQETLLTHYGYNGLYTQERRDCDFTVVSSLPTLDGLSAIPTTCKAAYVLYEIENNVQGFYVHKQHKICKKLDPFPLVLKEHFLSYKLQLGEAPSFRLDTDKLSTIVALARKEYHNVGYNSAEYQGWLQALNDIFEEAHPDQTLLFLHEDGHVIGLNWAKIKLKLFNVLVAKEYFKLEPALLTTVLRFLNMPADQVDFTQDMQQLLKIDFFPNARALHDFLIYVPYLNVKTEMSLFDLYIQKKGNIDPLSSLGELWEYAQHREAWKTPICERFKVLASKVKVPKRLSSGLVALIGTLDDAEKSQWLSRQDLLTAILREPSLFIPYFQLIAALPNEKKRRSLLLRQRNGCNALLMAFIKRAPESLPLFFSLLNVEDIKAILLQKTRTGDPFFGFVIKKAAWMGFAPKDEDAQALLPFLHEIEKAFPMGQGALTLKQKKALFDSEVIYALLSLLSLGLFEDLSLNSKIIHKIVTMIDYFPSKVTLLTMGCIYNNNVLMYAFRYGTVEDCRCLLENHVSTLPTTAKISIFKQADYLDKHTILSLLVSTSADRKQALIKEVLGQLRTLPAKVVGELLLKPLPQPVLSKNTFMGMVTGIPSEINEFIDLIGTLPTSQMARLLKSLYHYPRGDLRKIMAAELASFSAPNLLVSSRLLQKTRWLVEAAPILKSEAALFEQFAQAKQRIEARPKVEADTFFMLYEQKKDHFMQCLGQEINEGTLQQITTILLEMKLFVVLMEINAMVARFERVEDRAIYHAAERFYRALHDPFLEYIHAPIEERNAATLQRAWISAINSDLITPLQEYKGWDIRELLMQALAWLVALVGITKQFAEAAPKDSFKYRLFHPIPKHSEVKTAIQAVEKVIINDGPERI